MTYNVFGGTLNLALSIYPVDDVRLLHVQLKPWTWRCSRKTRWKIINIRWTGSADRSTIPEWTLSNTSSVESIPSFRRQMSLPSAPPHQAPSSLSDRQNLDRRRQTSTRPSARRCSCAEVPGNGRRSRTSKSTSASSVRARKVRRDSDRDRSRWEDADSRIIARDTFE